MRVDLLVGRCCPLLTVKVLFIAVLCLLPVPATAVAPNAASVALGKQLFERTWSQGDPRLGSDGLGPLFNATSCVACHNQGGSGGGGSAEFNAKTVGISKMQVTGGDVNDDQLAVILNQFYPGFQLSDGRLINCASLSHHGGSTHYKALTSNLLKQLPAEFAESGGPIDAAEVRRANAFPIQYSSKHGKLAVVIDARLFQRNTTALFGAGLIDQVPDKMILRQAKLQQSHSEISGRPSTLRSGRIGKFGWRANLPSLLHFTDQACANEVGLKTKRRDQPQDPTAPGYRNPSIDISDEQVIAIRDFTAALPAPTRRSPTDPADHAAAARGESLFASIGCSVCHVPDLGPAKGAYTDLLLHEMGYELMDLNHAEPYIERSSVTTRYVPDTVETVTGTTTGTQMMGAYYGSATVMSASSTAATSVSFTQRGAWTSDQMDRATSSRRPGDRNLSRLRSGMRSSKPGFQFSAPIAPHSQVAVVAVDVDPLMETGRTTSNESTVNVGQLSRQGMGRNRHGAAIDR